MVKNFNHSGKPGGGTGKFWNPEFPIRPRKFPFFYGWFLVFVATLGLCASMPGQTIGVGVFKTRLMEALGLSSMQLSVAYMLGTLLAAIFLGVGGRFFDRFGGRKALVYSVMALGLVLLGLSGIEWVSALFERIPLLNLKIWLPPFICLMIGFGLLRYAGQGMVTLSSRAIIGKWFDRRRGTVTAFSGALVSFMFSASPICLEYLIRKFSWQGAWMVMGLFMLLVLVPFFWLFIRDNPEECGLVMDGGPGKKARKPNPDSIAHRDYTRAEAARTFSFWAFTLTFGLSGLVVTAYTFHILAIAAELTVSTDYILMLFVPTAGVSVVSGFIIASVTDLSFVRIKYLLVLMGVGGCGAYASIGFGSYPDISWLHIASFGLSGGCFASLSTIVWPRFYGRSHLGAISGLFMTIIVITSAVGPFLFNLGERVFGGYRPGFIVCAVIAAGLAVAAFWADNPQRDHEPEIPGA